MRPKLLIVDDEADARRLLEYNFTAAGFDVASAASGKSALSQAARLTPDIVLLDIVLPDMDGFTVCRHLRAEPALAHIPVVMLSSHSGFSVQATGAEVGARRCLSKASNLDKIIAAVRLTLAESLDVTNQDRSPRQRLRA